MSEENLAIVQAFADRVNEQDIPGFLALIDPAPSAPRPTPWAY